MKSDPRKIQTAVYGGPESDDPLICPTEPDELELFLAEHPAKSFWCGVLLGGCGWRLTTRSPKQRVCHFAHFPDPDGLRPPCRDDIDRGVSSADHLYVKSTTQGWLRGQGHSPRYHFIDREDMPAGSLIDLYLGGRKLRFHLNAQVPPDWNDPEVGELILGPGVPIPPDRLEQLGHVNRVKFVTDGHRRVLVLGTQVFGESTVWNIDLDDCEITEDGRLMTPVAKRALSTRSIRSASPPAAVTAPPAQDVSSPELGGDVPGVQIGGLARDITTAVRSVDIARVRELCNQADLEVSRCEGPALAHLEDTAVRARNWLEGHDLKHRSVFTRLERAVSRGDSVAARTLLDEVKRLAAFDEPLTEEETDTLTAAGKLAFRPWERSVVPQATVSVFRPAEDSRAREERRERRLALAKARGLIGRLRANRVPAKERGELLAELIPLTETAGDWLSAQERRDVKSLLEQAEREARTLREEADKAAAPVALAVRGALRKAAREGRTTTWRQLEQQLGPAALPRMGIADQVRVLILVDEATASDQALLASLVVVDDAPLRAHYQEIAAAQGLEAPQDKDELRDVLDADVQQVFSEWARQ
ncbi:hypothetical protein [Streptomyces sp. NPDC017520]|uniref:hypothetical protein n=1 Tax=Streptomyces sp. NPDC017520 TaxID=3364998 RepID=UPI0037873764